LLNDKLSQIRRKTTKDGIRRGSGTWIIIRRRKTRNSPLITRIIRIIN